jgi:hypothetical protein
MKTVFLGEKTAVCKGSIVKGTIPKKGRVNSQQEDHGNISEWIEVWDYPGDNRFRGFVVGSHMGNSLFVFFDDVVYGKDLKQGWVFEVDPVLFSY